MAGASELELESALESENEGEFEHELELAQELTNEFELEHELEGEHEAFFNNLAAMADRRGPFAGPSSHARWRRVRR